MTILCRFFFILCLPSFLWADINLIQEENVPTSIPRTILAVFYKQPTEDMRFHPIHTYFEMPLNHLGLKLSYHDLAEGMPKVDNMDDVRGILAFFNSDAIPDPESFIDWSKSIHEIDLQLYKKYNLSDEEINFIETKVQAME